MSWRAEWLTAWNDLLDMLLPAVCPVCREDVGRQATLPCPACRISLTAYPSTRCPICALPYPAEVGNGHPCGDCLTRPPGFVGVVPLGVYQGPLRDCVQGLKYQSKPRLDRALGTLLAETLAQRFVHALPPDLLVPVPLHPHRLRQRGFNQALLLGREVGSGLRLPVCPHLLQRHRPTPPQQGLPARERRHNLRGAFSLTRPLQGERILLVDDVMTTGTTARECAATLLEGGARSVWVAVLARAPRS